MPSGSLRSKVQRVQRVQRLKLCSLFVEWKMARVKNWRTVVQEANLAGKE